MKHAYLNYQTFSKLESHVFAQSATGREYALARVPTSNHTCSRKVQLASPSAMIGGTSNHTCSRKVQRCELLNASMLVARITRVRAKCNRLLMSRWLLRSARITRVRAKCNALLRVRITPARLESHVFAQSATCFCSMCCIASGLESHVFAQSATFSNRGLTTVCPRITRVCAKRNTHTTIMD